MIDPVALKSWPFADIVHHYTADDAMRYALALGVGSDPRDVRQLQFVNDTVAGAPLPLPTLAVVLCYPGTWMQNPATSIDFTQIVHGEENVVWHRPLPAAGTVVARHDHLRQGPVRPRERRSARHGNAHDLRAWQRRLREQGWCREMHRHRLLCRCLRADRNPLHSDPEVARAAGFERPILHCLSTWGSWGMPCSHTVATPILHGSKACSPASRHRYFREDALRLEMYREGRDVRFRVRLVERDRVVLDHGHAVIEP